MEALALGFWCSLWILARGIFEGGCQPWRLVGVLFPFSLYNTPEMVALAHGAEALALGLWPLWCGCSGAMAPLERIPRCFPLWVVVLDLMAGLSRDAVSGGIFRGGTGSWLLALILYLGSRDGVFP